MITNSITIVRDGSEWLNVSGSSERSPKCRCDSWKKHWVNYSNSSWPFFCCVKNCGNEAVLGAHVHKVGSKKEYIAPFCESHNNTSEIIRIREGTVLVDANQSNTCGL